MTASFTTEGTYDPNSILAGNAHHLVAEKVTFKSGAGVIKRGTVVGKDGSGKYLTSLAGASDGSEVPSRIVAEDVDATSADVVGIVYKRGDFNADNLIYGTGHTADSVIAALGDDANIMLIKGA